jgi:hypothetical protein
MGKKRFTKYFIVFLLLLSGMIVSCQKDQEVNDESVVNSTKTDSSLTLNAPDNYLAVKGTLTITILDSTYSFDAAKDSVAFINVNSGDHQYFGITAINKDHNMSFGISSAGRALSNLTSSVAGSQFLLSRDQLPNIEYALTKYANSQDFGKINITSYKKDSTLAKGTFYTFLARDEKAASPFYKVKGTFSLRLK